jgi:hypothetical protein
MLIVSGIQLRKFKGGEVYKPWPAIDVRSNIFKIYSANIIKKARMDMQAA